MKRLHQIVVCDVCDVFVEGEMPKDWDEWRVDGHFTDAHDDSDRFTFYTHLCPEHAPGFRVYTDAMYRAWRAS